MTDPMRGKLLRTREVAEGFADAAENQGIPRPVIDAIEAVVTAIDKELIGG